MSVRLLLGSALVIAHGSVAVLAQAANSEFGTIQEAHALLARAIVEVKADKYSAFSKFNRNDVQYRDRDLFVFCFNRADGRFTAHEALVGWDVRNLRDANGKAFGEEMYRIAKEDRVDEVAFTSPVPGSTGKAMKLAYVTAVGDQICGVSSYRFGAQNR
jgi:hypothetical protein